MEKEGFHFYNVPYVKEWCDTNLKHLVKEPPENYEKPC